MTMTREIMMMILIVNDDVDNVLGEEIVDGKWGSCGSKELELSRKVGSEENQTAMVSLCQGCNYFNHYQLIRKLRRNVNYVQG